MVRVGAAGKRLADGAGGGAGAGAVSAGILRENRPLELAQALARLQPELLDQARRALR